MQTGREVCTAGLMVDLRDQFDYVGLWRRLGVALLDLLILSPIALLGARLDNYDRSGGEPYVHILTEAWCF